MQDKTFRSDSTTCASAIAASGISSSNMGAAQPRLEPADEPSPPIQLASKVRRPGESSQPPSAKPMPKSAAAAKPPKKKTDTAAAKKKVSSSDKRLVAAFEKALRKRQFSEARKLLNLMEKRPALKQLVRSSRSKLEVQRKKASKKQ